MGFSTFDAAFGSSAACLLGASPDLPQALNSKRRTNEKLISILTALDFCVFIFFELKFLDTFFMMFNFKNLTLKICVAKMKHSETQVIKAMQPSVSPMGKA